MVSNLPCRGHRCTSPPSAMRSGASSRSWPLPKLQRLRSAYETGNGLPVDISWPEYHVAVDLDFAEKTGDELTEDGWTLVEPELEAILSTLATVGASQCLRSSLAPSSMRRRSMDPCAARRTASSPSWPTTTHGPVCTSSRSVHAIDARVRTGRVDDSGGR